MIGYTLSCEYVVENYSAFLNVVRKNCDYFSIILDRKYDKNYSKEFSEFIDNLEPYLVVTFHNPKITCHFWPKVFQVYRLCKQTKRLLAENKYILDYHDDKTPDIDIAFYQFNRRMWFSTIIHEDLAFFYPFSDEELSDLRGTGIAVPEYRKFKTTEFYFPEKSNVFDVE